ncbi:reverse transcriptase [Purpureocillium lavendulum]|uniref:Reverse transcriptase n=1 Tax=Purpureocillium lavendulum TaxID=1247861 RepID=A0AB34FFI9_9HYPO|nr:reverse transcriptase [Purpureocillium lavendulum]
MKRQRTQSPDQRCVCARRELPAWYYRLVALTIKEDRDVSPEDFDEDLSDLNEAGRNSERESNTIIANCECDDEDSECECQLHSDAADTLSERSYSGSDADFYYELRDEREERKWELRDMKEREGTAKRRRRELERNREEEVQAACELLRQTDVGGCRPRLDPIAGKTFYLFSVDHVDHCYNPQFPELYPTKYVEFYTLHEEDTRCEGVTG